MDPEGKEHDAEESGNHTGEGLLRVLGFITQEIRFFEEKKEAKVVFESTLSPLSPSPTLSSLLCSFFLPLFLLP